MTAGIADPDCRGRVREAGAKRGRIGGTEIEPCSSRCLRCGIPQQDARGAVGVDCSVERDNHFAVGLRIEHRHEVDLLLG